MSVDIKPVIRTTKKDYPFKFSEDVESWLKKVAREATYWTHLIRNRRRWSGGGGLGAQRDRAVNCLIDLGLKRNDLIEIGRARIAEVRIPFVTEDIGWQLRVFPWEYVLSCATSEGLTVLRHLDTGEQGPKLFKAHRVLYVESTPEGIGSNYTFDSEEELVQSNLQPKAWAVLEDPTPERLSREIEEKKPDVLHLAGFDTHQGQQLRRVERPDRRTAEPASPPDDVLDGYMMTDERHQPLPLDCERLGAMVTGTYHKGAKKGHRPSLVSFSFWNSGARVAAMAVASGASAAVGFQDSLDDGLMELFFASFYRALRQEKFDISFAFDEALRFVHAQPSLGSGSGLVLWSRTSLIKQTADIQARSEKKDKPGLLRPGQVTKHALQEILRVPVNGIKPTRELNYSALHNRGKLFDSFTLQNDSTKELGDDKQADLADIDVRVVLSAGSESACYERRVTLSGPALDLTKEVHVPLTSELLRSAREAVNSSMLVEVKWGEQLVYRDTHKVRLLPIDQWRDNDKDGIWLPSFVLPRDPAVVKLVEKAQRYVRVLRDDPSSGFDGYQSINMREADPYAEVDLQVQAIWSTVIHELQLGYVNPPPTYSTKMDSQRLRTPSMTISSQCGTCIDLALLVASCLELVDIYPVIFLLNDHAFPGYWRSPERHEALKQMSDVTGDDLQGERKEGSADPEVPAGWCIKGASAYDEIIKQLRLGGGLVPLESVWLTEHSGFWSAVEGGRDHLKDTQKDRRRFHSMLDIALAREANVTPIPLWGSHA